MKIFFFKCNKMSTTTEDYDFTSGEAGASETIRWKRVKSEKEDYNDKRRP